MKLFLIMVLIFFPCICIAETSNFDVTFNNTKLNVVDVMYDVDRNKFLIEFKTNKGYTKGYFTPSDVQVKINDVDAFDKLTESFIGKNVGFAQQEELISTMINDCLFHIKTDEEKIQYETNVKMLCSNIHGFVKNIIYIDMVYETWDYQPEEYNERLHLILEYIMGL